MKAMQMLKIALVVLFLVAGIVGCAKTPQPEMVSQADMSSQPEVKPVAEKPMMPEETIPMHEQMAGMEKILFDFDQFTLSDKARGTLAKNAEYLKAHGATQVVIEGHCDERGSDEYNLALGESRALAAKSYLVDLGISASRLSVISYGEEKPQVMGMSEEAYAQNRRAEFKAVQ